MEPRSLQQLRHIRQRWDDIVVMEEEEQLPQVRQCLEDAVWSVGVHLGGREGHGGRGRWRSKGENTLCHSFPGPLWTRPHPFHGLRRLLFDPEDEVRGVFRDADGGRLQLVAALLQQRPRHSDALRVIVGRVGLQPAAGGCRQCCGVNMGALLIRNVTASESSLPLFSVVVFLRQRNKD